MIKDCTLGGRYPALGLALKSGDPPRYRYKIGCDPVLEISLQRCFTELLQGVSGDDALRLFRTASPDAAVSRAERRQGFVRFMFNRLEELPEGLVRRCDAPYDLTPFEARFLSHRHSLRRLVRGLRGTGHDLFVRACGFLGFPAYWVYVPELSPIYELNEEVLELLLRDRPFVLSCVLRPEDRSRSELRRCAALLARARLNNQFRRLFPYHLHAGYRGLNEELILFLLFARAGALEEARQYLAAYLEEYGQALGTSLVRELLDHPESVARGFERVSWPLCGDCSRCPVEATCFVHAWRDIDRRLVACMEASPVEQQVREAVFDA